MERNRIPPYGDKEEGNRRSSMYRSPSGVLNSLERNMSDATRPDVAMNDGHYSNPAQAFYPPRLYGVGEATQNHLIPQHPSEIVPTDRLSHPPVSITRDAMNLQRSQHSAVASADSLAMGMLREAITNAVNTRIEVNGAFYTRVTATTEVTAKIMREVTQITMEVQSQAAREQPSYTDPEQPSYIHPEQRYRHYRSRSPDRPDNVLHVGQIQGRPRGRSRSPQPNRLVLERERRGGGYSLGNRMDGTVGSGTQHMADIPAPPKIGRHEFECRLCGNAHSHSKGNSKRRCPNRCPCKIEARLDHLKSDCTVLCVNRFCTRAVQHRAVECNAQCAICGQKGNIRGTPQHAGLDCRQSLCSCGNYGHWAYDCPKPGTIKYKKPESRGTPGFIDNRVPVPVRRGPERPSFDGASDVFQKGPEKPENPRTHGNPQGNARMGRDIMIANEQPDKGTSSQILLQKAAAELRKKLIEKRAQNPFEHRNGQASSSRSQVHTPTSAVETRGPPGLSMNSAPIPSRSVQEARGEYRTITPPNILQGGHFGSSQSQRNPPAQTARVAPPLLPPGRDTDVGRPSTSISSEMRWTGSAAQSALSGQATIPRTLNNPAQGTMSASEQNFHQPLGLPRRICPCGKCEDSRDCVFQKVSKKNSDRDLDEPRIPSTQEQNLDYGAGK